eukprot:m.210887 g.210887  ORF g.210887 m.210887 type:complete len:74 (-) comp16941_c0_seq1:23-244(-)
MPWLDGHGEQTWLPSSLHLLFRLVLSVLVECLSLSAYHCLLAGLHVYRLLDLLYRPSSSLSPVPLYTTRSDKR